MADEMPVDSRYTTSSLQPRTTRLLGRFEEIKDILTSSEITRGDPLATEGTDILINSENSPYGCDESYSSIGQKLWGLQPASWESLKPMLLDCLPYPLRYDIGLFSKWDEPEEVIDYLAERGLIDADVMHLFRALGVQGLNLTPSLAPDPAHMICVNPRQVLKVFQLPHSFRDLESLSLRSIPLRDDDLVLLHALRLHQLDLSHTGISAEGTAHLVVFKPYLEWLDIENNPKIGHCASYNLACLVNLRYLNCKRTTLKMISFRYIVQRVLDYNPLASIDLEVPSAIRKYLLTVADKYQAFIPDPYLRLDTLKRLKGMSYTAVRKNLEYHHLKDPKISLKGTVDELAKRLKKHIRRRDADFKLKNWANLA